ncbi:MAG: hypothetical protein O3A02_04325 [bacterium]|nr:hypothetical protein [bacterium]
MSGATVGALAWGQRQGAALPRRLPQPVPGTPGQVVRPR